MTLVKCRECGKDVSGKASACPHCGIALTSGRAGLQALGDTVGVLWNAALTVAGLGLLAVIVGALFLLL